MAQYIQNANIFGRIGSGIGKGLAESVPKEIERSRLASGLKGLNEKQGLTPFQQFSELAAIPGVTPQMLESGSKLLRESARAQGLQGQQTAKANPFTQKETKGRGETSKHPSLTQSDVLAKVQEGYIPPTQQDIYNRAGQMYNENPALFGNDPDKALAAAESEANRENQIAQAYQTKHENLSSIQDKVVSRLKNYTQGLGVAIPPDIYSKLEDEAIQATLPTSKGGKGFTEGQSVKEIGNKLDQISRQYKDLESLGSWGMTGRPANKTLGTLKALQKDFKNRDDTDNMALRLIGTNQLSPEFAYSLAEPVSNNQKVNDVLKKAPTKIYQELGNIPQIPGAQFGGPEQRVEDTLVLSEELAPLMDENTSPLAIAYELGKKGYDPQVWRDYITSNPPDKMNTKQIRQLTKSQGSIPSLGDWWLQSWSGIE